MTTSNSFGIKCSLKHNNVDYIVEAGSEEDGTWVYYGTLAGNMPGRKGRYVFVPADKRLESLSGKSFTKFDGLIAKINKILLEEYKNLFIVSYMVAGDDCQGAYLVNATTKGKAKAIVQAFDEDYCKIRVQNVKEYIDDMGFEEFMQLYIDHGAEVKNDGDAYSLWSGT